MRLKIVVLVLLIVANTSLVYGQLNAVVTGDAFSQGNNCYVITQDLGFQAGGVWYDNPIDFDADFTIYYQNNFGNKDANGADGMALVFKRNATPVIGGAGGGVGYSGILSSLVVEFDTFQNLNLGDPSIDHISIMRDGVSSHNSGNNLSGPVQASSTSINIEDGNTHEVRIDWNATTKVLNVFFDCVLRLSLVTDIKNNIFSGDDSVFFGFVGSTGGLTNLHQVCFNRVSFVDNLQLQDEIICDQEPVQVDATIPSGVTYSWLPITGVSNPSVPNPMLAPTITTTYTVTIADICGETTTEDLTVTVLPVVNSIFTPVAPICEGDTLNNLPLDSNNGISGTWSPAINNTVTTVYTFTPNTGECGTVTTLQIIVNPKEIPVFDTVAPICSGDSLANLPTVSNNGISGSWSPALNNTATTTYTFLPNAGICAETTTLEIVVNPIETPIFDAISPVCSGDSLTELPTVSNNGITGIWTPAIDNMVTTVYTFTPEVGECATTITLEVVVNPIETPSFNSVAPICSGDSLTELPTVSNNGITGTWAPALDNTTTTTYTFTPAAEECAITTTLEISVTPIDTPDFDTIDPICSGDFLADLSTVSNNGITGTWSPTIDNTSSTVYTFTPDTGQGCTEITTLEIIVNATTPVFDLIEAICEGDPLEELPTISNNGISGVWSPVINNLITTTYIFTPNDSQCSVETTLEIVVIPIAQISVEVEIRSQPFSDNQIIEAIATGGNGSYEYQLDYGPWVTDSIFVDVSGCEDHLIRARQISSCSTTASRLFQILDYPKYFTPNGDGTNDIWNIDCLRDQSGARIAIFNRFGKLLAVINPSVSGWDGIYNNTIMPTSDYWFKVEYFGDDGSPRVFTSHFTLKR